MGMYKTLEWTGDGLTIIDQTEIPARLVYRKLSTSEEIFEAIQKLRIRGAPAIGVAAAYGLYLALSKKQYSSSADLQLEARRQAAYLNSARPTAVNLKWALVELLEKLYSTNGQPDALLDSILAHAKELQRDDEQRCMQIATMGAPLIQENSTIITHCNTGPLATAGRGTALSIIIEAHRRGRKINVLVDETRPLLQGARLTMWELKQAGVPATLIADNMAAYAMKIGKVQMAIVGADRIAANGDAANKIGTYGLAVLCRYHNIPFYIAAPLSTFDSSIKSGEEIPIEMRDNSEITNIWDRLEITVPGAAAWNPAFDVTPANLITGIVTERGILNQPFENSIKELNLNNKFHKNNEEFIV